MKGFIKDIDWLNATAMKYWAPPASYSLEKKKTEVNNAIFSGDYVGALKVDGYYQRLLKDEDGNCFMIARNLDVNGNPINKIEWIPHLNPFFEALPNGTCLLSEVYLPGNEGSKKITSILGCLKEKAIQRQEKQKLHLYVFDVMAWDGKNFADMAAEARFLILYKISEIIKNEYVEYAVYYEGKELWDKLQAYLADGREGVVLMKKTAPVYFKRTPAHVSIKVKKELQETVDCFFTGRAMAPTKDYGGKEIETWPYWYNYRTEERLPEGNHLYEAEFEKKPYRPCTKPYYFHWAGSLEIGVLKDGKVKPIGFLSGLTDEIKANYKDYEGRCIEVAAMEKFEDTQALRHGKMIGFRDDLTAADCTWEKYIGK